MSESEVSEATQETEVPATETTSEGAPNPAYDPASQAATDAFGALRIALKDYTMSADIEDPAGLHKMVRGAGFASAIFAIERVWTAGGSIGGKVPNPGARGVSGGAKRGRKSNAEKAAQAAAEAAGVDVEGVETAEGQVEMDAPNSGRGRGRRNA